MKQKKTPSSQRELRKSQKYIIQNDDEGFAEEKDLLFKQYDGSKTEYVDEVKEEEESQEIFRQQTPSYLLRLPEANPLLDSSKQVKDEPKIIFKSLSNRYLIDEDGKGNSRRQQSSPFTSNNKQQVEEKQEERESELQQKYSNPLSEYRLIYSKYAEEGSDATSKLSFVGFCQSLKNAFSITGKQANKGSSGDGDIFKQLKEIHQYQSLQEYECKKQSDYINNGISQIQFNSKFECGNLMYVFQRKNTVSEYDLLLGNDINSKGYTQWFYFSVSQVQQGRQIRFNIVNHSKKHSLFKNGMKPAVYSIQKNKNNTKVGWERAGDHVRYYENKQPQIKEGEIEASSYYSLSFTYTFEYNNDTVFFAMTYPYTYTEMISHLNTSISNKLKTIYLKKETLCQSISGLSVPMITITNKENDGTSSKKQNHEGKQKRVAFIMARQHPGETVSSYLMQGLIDYLLGDSTEAEFLRSKYIFKIIPMVNPDGVVFGNFRCNLSGVDLNRQWNNPSRLLHPCIYYIKKMILEYQRNKYIIDYFIDLHGHSKKLNSFIYACKVDNDENACCVFPMMLSKLNTICNYSSCTFGLESYKENTARGVAWNCGISKPNIFTVETSFFGYESQRQEDSSKVGIHFSQDDLKNFGADLARVMFVYHIEVIGDESNKSVKSIVTNEYSQLQKDKMLKEIAKQNPILNNYEDSGSDSDPLADELDDTEKIVNIIGQKFAKSLGLVQTQSINNNNNNNNQSQSSSSTNLLAKGKVQILPFKRKSIVDSLTSSVNKQVNIKRTQRSPLQNASLQAESFCQNHLQTQVQFQQYTSKITNRVQRRAQTTNSPFSKKDLFKKREEEQLAMAKIEKKESSYRNSFFKLQEDTSQYKKLRWGNGGSSISLYGNATPLSNTNGFNSPQTLSPKGDDVMINLKAALKYKSSNVAMFLRAGITMGDQDPSYEASSNEQFMMMEKRRGSQLDELKKQKVPNSGPETQLFGILEQQMDVLNGMQQVGKGEKNSFISGYHLQQSIGKSGAQTTRELDTCTEESSAQINQQSGTIGKATSFHKRVQDEQKQKMIFNFSKMLKENSKKYNCDTKILHMTRIQTPCQMAQRIPPSRETEQGQPQILKIDCLSSHAQRLGNMSKASNLDKILLQTKKENNILTKQATSFNLGIKLGSLQANAKGDVIQPTSVKNATGEFTLEALRSSDLFQKKLIFPLKNSKGKVPIIFGSPKDKQRNNNYFNKSGSNSSYHISNYFGDAQKQAELDYPKPF